MLCWGQRMHEHMCVRLTLTQPVRASRIEPTRLTTLPLPIDWLVNSMM